MAEWLNSLPNILIYLLIFSVKIFEVSLAVLRIVLITKGERIIGACIGFFEVVIWVIVVATVLTNITEDPIQIFVYAFAFSVGNYTGSWIENKLALGTVKIEAIVKKIHGKQLAMELRTMNFAVTCMDAYGRDDRKEVLYMHVPRRKIKETIETIKSFQKDVVITINDIRPIFGGHGILRK